MLLDTSPLAFAAVVVATVLWKKRQDENEKDESSPEVVRLRRLMASGQLMHPFLRAKYFQRNQKNASCIEEEDYVANFTDLASALATCCGVSVDSSTSSNNNLEQDIGTNTRHVLVILCDGMGNAILQKHLSEPSFLRRHNQSDRLRAVFPSTTPAALTTLATAQWPGQHGVPGWDLREQPGCDYPGEANGGSIIQLRILAPRVMNVRDNEPANYSSLDDVFLATPWSRTLAITHTPRRRMMYINAYNGDDFPSWYQGKTDTSHASDFSSWQTGQTKETSTLMDVATIGETSSSTLGKPEGSQTALEYFKDGINKALRFVAQAEGRGESTFTYLYTAHPDKHMHALGTDHPEVHALVRGINDEIQQMWYLLGDRSTLMYRYGVEAEAENSTLEASNRLDAAIIVTADHGHVSVFPEDMIVMPDNIIDCLEYANIGVHGKVSERQSCCYFA